MPIKKDESVKKLVFTDSGADSKDIQRIEVSFSLYDWLYFGVQGFCRELADAIQNLENRAFVA